MLLRKIIHSISYSALSLYKIQSHKSDLSLSVSNSGTTSRLALNCDGEELDYATVRITGFVEFSDLENEGYTTINGANITTGNINNNNAYNTNGVAPDCENSSY